MRVDDKLIANECNKSSSSQLFAAGGWGPVAVQDGRVPWCAVVSCRCGVGGARAQVFV